MGHRLLRRTCIGRGLRKRRGQANTVKSAVAPYIAVGVGVGDEFLSPGINEEANEIGTHVVATKVGEGLGQVCLIEVDLVGRRAKLAS